MRIRMPFAIAISLMLPVFASAQAVRETATLDQSAKGSADDLHIHTFMKLTITPDGKVANDMFDQTVDCRG